MKFSVIAKSNFTLVLLPLSFILFFFFLVRSPLFLSEPNQLSSLITLDLLVTLPAFYFLLIRKRDIPKITVVSMFIVGLISASYILPSDQQSVLKLVKTYFLPLVEFGIVGFIIFNVRKGLKLYQSKKNNERDFFTILQSVTQDLMPAKIAHLFATEIAVVYYSLFSWRREPIKENEFSYHKKSGIVSVIVVLIGLAIIETIVVHILLVQWNQTIAWILTILSIYTCFQLFSIMKSMSRRPISFNDAEEVLHLRFGFANYVDISYEEIKSIELSSKSFGPESKTIQLSAFGMLDTHNIYLHLKDERTLNRIYGLKSKFKSIVLYIDEKEKFETKIKSIIEMENEI